MLTGAGISAESGIKTFRATDGLWENHRIEDVATPAKGSSQPGAGASLYNMRRADAARAQPNAAHRALGAACPPSSGHPDHPEMSTTCMNAAARPGFTCMAACWARFVPPAGIAGPRRWSCARSICVPVAAKPATRPRYRLVRADPLSHGTDLGGVENAEIFAAIGTSGRSIRRRVWRSTPAARARETVELNLAASAVSSDFTDHRTGPATEVVPAGSRELCR